MGEMEVWALEAYSAAHMLREMTTVKSDDVEGRNKMYSALLEGGGKPPPLKVAGAPAAYDLLEKELQAAGLSLSMVYGDEALPPSSAQICPVHQHTDKCSDNKALRKLRSEALENAVLTQRIDDVAEEIGEDFFEELLGERDGVESNA